MVADTLAGVAGPIVLQLVICGSVLLVGFLSFCAVQEWRLRKDNESDRPQL